MRSAGSFGYLLKKEGVRVEEEAREVTKIKMTRLLREARGESSLNPFRELLKVGSRHRGELFISISAVIFGVTLVYQRKSNISALAFSAMRQCFSFCISLVLIPIIRWTNMVKSESDESALLDSSVSRGERRCKLAYYGLMIAIGSTGGNVFQQIGLIGDCAGKAGFLGSFQVVFTPLLDSVLHGINASMYDWYAAILSLIGIFILSGSAMSTSLSLYDLSLVISALFWSLNITFGDRGARILDTLDLSMTDFGLSSILSILVCVLSSARQEVLQSEAGVGATSGTGSDLNDFFFSAAAHAELPLVVGTAFSQTLAVILAKLGFMTVASPKASLLIALNSVAAAMAGYAVLGEAMRPHEVLGSLIMLFASIASISGFGTISLSSPSQPGQASDVDTAQGGERKYGAIGTA